KRDQLWWHKIQPFVKTKCHFSPGTEFFHNQNGIHFPLTWQVDCFWVDGKLLDQPYADIPLRNVDDFSDFDPENPHCPNFLDSDYEFDDSAHGNLFETDQC